MSRATAAPKPAPTPPVRAPRLWQSPGFWPATMFSMAANLLLLTGPLFMLQVYDRVLSSGSVPTLVALGLLVAVLYLFYGVLDALRARIMTRLSALLDDRLADVSFTISTLAGLRRDVQDAGQYVLTDLRRIRQFLSGPGINNLFDLPWMPLYLGVVFLLHPWLGIAGSIAGLVLVVLTGLHASRITQPIEEAMAADQRALSMANQAKRQVESLVAMGMIGRLRTRWRGHHQGALAATLTSGDAVAVTSAFSKTLRLAIQSLILGVGAYLVILQEITPGAMIAASIIFGRAFQPLEQVTAHWRSLSEALLSRKRLKAALKAHQAASVSSILPMPRKNLVVEGLDVTPPQGTTPLLRDVSFSLEAGDGLGIIGHSGCGKTSLAKTLIGAWAPLTGEFRLDGATLEQWPGDDRGRLIGYLPQDIELFDGTIQENIARFQEGAAEEDVLTAAKLAGAHELILGLPAGYDTLVGPEGLPLSAGQRQRAALARAVFGDPFLVVLDEPNANLDAVGEQALQLAIRKLIERNAIVIVIAHRPGAIAEVNKLLWLDQGEQKMVGPKETVLQNLMPTAKKRAGGQGTGGLRVVQNPQT